MPRLSKLVLIGSVTGFVAVAALLYLNKRFALPTDRLETYNPSANSEPELPPGEPPPIKFAVPNMTSAERQAFLTGDYKIVRKVADLAAGIRKLYTAMGGSRLAIADPGEKFEATDVITDPNLPRRRLIFGGVAQGRAFIHYEEGGIAHSYIVELFRLESPDKAIGLWSGYCGPATSLEEIEQLLLEEGRDSCQSEVKWQSVDQLCGILRFASPKKKTITTVDGRVETRLYENDLNGANMKLYRGTHCDRCSSGRIPEGHTKSGKFGKFELPGFQSGWYWMLIESQGLTTKIPLHVTSDFNEKSCHDPSVGRIFTVDAQPPTVETRIY